MSKKTVVPTKTTEVKNWTKEIESKNYYNGIEIAKVNGKSVGAKDGTTPLFTYKNAKGLVGNWYSVEDTYRIDKTMQNENKRFKNDLDKSEIAGKLSKEQIDQVLAALGLK